MLIVEPESLPVDGHRGRQYGKVSANGAPRAQHAHLAAGRVWLSTLVCEYAPVHRLQGLGFESPPLH